MSVALAYNNVSVKTDELQELIEGCIRNERSAQAKIYHLFYPRMMSMVKRYFPEQVNAEEILNNGFLRAFQKMSTFSFKGSFEGWLRRIIFHAIADYASSNIKYKQSIVLAEKDEFVHKDHANQLYYNDLLKLIQELPEATRVVFNMFVLDDMPHKHIAKTLGISEGTSKWHVSEARRMLKEKVEQQNLHLKK
ncbi:RNA polymerase sigma factor [Taibaiella chishuiensis]|uniref:RNA polymerase sigma-70 factor (ECF subfamily) n=1 Tax=Taibaiella chishuiensis TaxID=1434707 RepID=A0A2P8CYM6_9BACT|nr:RNA polymerase sigma-70 factor (ECF subfamily) [Taibaiella chishuiensis]